MQTYRDFIRDQDRAPAIVAHRGAWHAAPENSMAAIEQAIAAGYEIIEIDIQQSQDGVLFVHHDETLDRMAGKPAIAHTLPMTDLAATRLKDRNGRDGAPLTDQVIQTLETVLTKTRGRAYFDLDVKYPRDLAATAELVAKLDMADLVNVKTVVQTQAAADDLCALEATHGVMVKPMTRFSDGDADFLFGLLEGLAPAMVEIEFDRLDTLANRREAFRRAGIAIWVNTLDSVACGTLTDTAALGDPDAVWGTLIDAGVSIFQTDEPEALSAYLAARRAAA